MLMRAGMPRQIRLPFAVAAALAAVTAATPALAQVVPPAPDAMPSHDDAPAGPFLPQPAPPPERAAPRPPAPPPSITPRDVFGQVKLLDSGAEEAAARALGIDEADSDRLNSAADRHRAALDRLAVDHLGLVLNTVLPARATLDRASVTTLRSLIRDAAVLRPPSLLARLEREGIITPEQHRLARTAVSAHIHEAAEAAVLRAASAGSEAVIAARLRTEFLLATGEAAASADRLLLAAMNRWPLIEPDLDLTPNERAALAAAVVPALDRMTLKVRRVELMAEALADLDLEVAAAILRAGSPTSFIPEQPHRLPTPLTAPSPPPE
jgi:hypothetical protein